MTRPTSPISITLSDMPQFKDTDICDGCGQRVEREDTVVAGRGALWHRRCAPPELLEWPTPRGTTHTQLTQMHLDAEAESPNAKADPAAVVGSASSALLGGSCEDMKQNPDGTYSPAEAM